MKVHVFGHRAFVNIQRLQYAGWRQPYNVELFRLDRWTHLSEALVYIYFRTLY